MTPAAEQLVLAVPTWQCERFVAATLQSLNAQGDCVRWHLQDGASTDATAQIARGLARPGDVVVSEADSGQTDALNRAMRQMGGEYIGFINGDDCLLPGAAQRVLDCFAAHPEADLVCGQIEWIDEEGAVTGRHAGRIRSLAEALDIYEVWWRGRQWVQPEVFFRRRLWEKVGGFDLRYHLAFDYDFWVRCFLAGAQVVHLDAPLAQFRLHAAQKSQAAQRAASEIREISKRHLPAARLPLSHRLLLRARLDYDRYQSGDTGPKRPLPLALLQNLHWLLAPEVWHRMLTACGLRDDGRTQIRTD